jgi:tRNA pseudouridine55 synthase
MEGFVLIDKPDGPTSHDVVDAVRRFCGIRKVGHAGTLDPFATGLLIVGVGKATKEMQKLVGLDKEYEATLRLGATSDTYDRTGVIKRTELIQLTEEKIKAVVKKFTGTIKQIPPMYSAKKIKGKKLYELARKGVEVERQPSTITIHSIKLLKLQAPSFKFQVSCSSGTYIRSLAHDIGQALGCGAYLTELRRTAIGSFLINESTPLSKLSPENFSTHLQSVKSILDRTQHISYTHPLE